MALVGEHDLGLLARAAGPGRIRGIGLELLGAVDAAPERAGATLAAGLRGARALHSRERRLVGDLLRDDLRWRALLDDRLGETVEPAMARWLANLVRRGLAAETALTAWHDAHPGSAPSFAGAPGWTDRPAAEPDLVGQVARFGSVDRSVAASLVVQLGEEALDYFVASNQRAPLCLRVNTLRTDRDALVAVLAARGIATEPCSLAENGLRVLGTAQVEVWPEYRDGRIEVQDEGSQHVVELVPKGATSVIDLCAGAGGKTLAIAARAPAARILACDPRAAALNELQRRAARAGVSRLRTAEDPGDEQADVVLVDAPCTGSGVLRRHPEHRLRLDGRAIERAARLQREILDRAASLVNPGGLLVYATCSVLAEENERVVEHFAAAHPEMAVEQPFLHLWPQREGTDGFFAALLRGR